MHKLALAGLYALVATLTPSPTDTSVSVLYAGSLVTAMEGPIKNALLESHLTFDGEPGGSKALANLILAGVRTPDVFISVDPRIVASLGARVASATTFAGTSLGVAWAPTSQYAALFDAVADRSTSLQRALETPGLRIGRTDPQLDPKGAYTLQAVRMWLGGAGERRLLGDDQNPAQIFPEQDLLARVDTGQADVGFFYHTEAIARGYRFVPLPGMAALTDRITYTLAVMRAAPHPKQAKAFAEFILIGRGRTILERAGLTYLKPPP
ncbi:MAG: extracellular solute-binding protein [Candidatus Eremiobacteraeota bacterium]|nr:extracellular solute-binding protein [Candidatus Eremiobacteraeota bacterium]